MAVRILSFELCYGSVKLIFYSHAHSLRILFLHQNVVIYDDSWKNNILSDPALEYFLLCNVLVSYRERGRRNRMEVSGLEPTFSSSSSTALDVV